MFSEKLLAQTLVCCGPLTVERNKKKLAISVVFRSFVKCESKSLPDSRLKS